jgi:hypothetical protein
VKIKELSSFISRFKFLVLEFEEIINDSSLSLDTPERLQRMWELKKLFEYVAGESEEKPSIYKLVY